jgi:hypothetical protein
MHYIIRPNRYAAFEPDFFDVPLERIDNEFNRNYQRMVNESPSTNIFLNITMHGMFVRNPEPITIPGMRLNKFSVAAPGQCTHSNLPEDYHIQYSLYHAIKKHSIIDVPTIIKEAIATSNATLFRESQSNIDRSYAYELKEPHSNVHYTGKVGDTTTFGNSFFEKTYTIDPNPDVFHHGIFLCNDWEEIGGFAMDNLLTNLRFIDYINKRYGEENSIQAKQMFIPVRRVIRESKLSIKFINSRDLYEFCVENGKPDITVLDKSCSVFSAYSKNNPIEEYQRLNLYPEVAKGKRTRKIKKGKIKKSKKPHKSKKPKKI